MSISKSDSYAAAGVDVTAGYASNNLIKPMVESTYIPGVIGTLGGFGGCFQLPAGYTEPVLVSGTDGVGTKLKLAYLMDRHDTVGVDCVAMCVNDIICGGAKPLFFLDYMAMGKNVPERTAEIVKGVVEGCTQAGCALIGGETAEMPGLYAEDEYDLAGLAGDNQLFAQLFLGQPGLLARQCDPFGQFHLKDLPVICLCPKNSRIVRS